VPLVEQELLRNICVTQWVPLVEQELLQNICITQRVPLVEQKLLQNMRHTTGATSGAGTATEYVSHNRCY
jgi:hypothetical protein